MFGTVRTVENRPIVVVRSKFLVRSELAKGILTRKFRDFVMAVLRKKMFGLFLYYELFDSREIAWDLYCGRTEAVDKKKSSTTTPTN